MSRGKAVVPGLLHNTCFIVQASKLMKTLKAIVSSSLSATVVATSAFAILCLAPLPASAIKFGPTTTSIDLKFDGITGLAVDQAIGEKYYNLNIAQVKNQPQQVEFTFRNNAPKAENSAIKGIFFLSNYFDKTIDPKTNKPKGLTDLFTGTPTLTANPSEFRECQTKNGVKTCTDDVKFTQDSKPQNFVGFKQNNNKSTYSFGADSPAGAFKHGIDYGQSLVIGFNLVNKKTVQDIFQAINRGDFAVGVHSGSFPSGDSAKFVNVPEPFSILGSGLALGMGVLLKRESDKKRQRPSEKVAKSQVLG